jgi:hypothetical protein
MCGVRLCFVRTEGTRMTRHSPIPNERRGGHKRVGLGWPLLCVRRFYALGRVGRLLAVRIFDSAKKALLV